ncbi:MAG: hypothetical protein A3A96_01705 [Candidatus Zambryskibacteria bacterium RIFCSPLOWO2_01_FULL_39_39]|uniref:methionyl-tRNA formyltransferase n=1 Tax=Candidatus Zambryskibacteria bacterium RIFCSPLOWO2_01_FULL_39_39 TaxID=1802758 RepID=A0A1G2TXP6_9BACT|nr:MAG: Methionyl-tRNA formyltransferase [Parcubacteria group bacterium GW2011_GWA1_38_7]OHA86569.1 MAG: hypothetical protein A2644_01820 [Candidatus Zambryskibacteria bacterium RIFCSPHIGHO2_01_FULL_39_63]OHA94262.1 MAG: hypothetical protein A3B88_03895 [Candidatus Zambryskibacteria bacterium RIFCSPHIGHO2_02_FULL_39_19]OHA98471.1 MAG: hypothetical protein A3F20_03600 [Candidatus Zambryskibacteria bacterium RIFCSPHIGHO2_12_FULL_39_21]OHB01390.1 MAG: hypothetical protein A3A96_01705 [Candidatus Z
MINKVHWAFFGSSRFSVYVLDELKQHGMLPNLLITIPDRPKGRKMILTPNEVRVWGQKNNIEVFDPETLRSERGSNAEEFLRNTEVKFGDWDLFLVASYGKIIPKEIFEIPKHKTLNIHPSLLPKYRGASPIQSQILNNDTEVGVSIMQIEEAMDTGPIVIQKPLPNPSPCQGEEQGTKGAWGEVGRKELEKILAIEGAGLFAHILPEWLLGAIDPIIQNEDKATYCQKIKKEDGFLDLSDNPLKNLLKIKAFEEWPTSYYFNKEKRIIITDATIEDDKLKILKIIPEGKKEMLYEDFLRGNK